MESDIQYKFKQLKVGVLIPTYNNSTSLGGVIDNVLRFTDQIIIVNDGSKDTTADVLKNYPTVDIIQYKQNTGKGWALRQGFDRARKLGYDHVITLDSDGQHDPADLPKFLLELEQNNGELIMGARNMEQAGVPSQSSFGNKFSNFWFWFETGKSLPDTQTGYRCYPLSAVADIRFYSRKFEFEIEVIVRSVWNGIAISSVPVNVYYPPREKRVSHFRPFTDFMRISVLNTILVTLALVYYRPRDFIRSFKKKKFRQHLLQLLSQPGESDGIKATSIGFGIFMGIVPIWGFQLIVAIATAIVLRLNKALVVIAANISIPPAIPFILYLSHVTGGVWMGENAESLRFDSKITLVGLRDSIVQYTLGAVTLALVAGCSIGLISYVLLKVFRKSR
ncbi:MAG: DUF2062 domain-containing protein [Cyclobacteriaceae bacterium]